MVIFGAVLTNCLAASGQGGVLGKWSLDQSPNAATSDAGVSHQKHILITANELRIKAERLSLTGRLGTAAIDVQSFTLDGLPVSTKADTGTIVETSLGEIGCGGVSLIVVRQYGESVLMKWTLSEDGKKLVERDYHLGSGSLRVETSQFSRES
jgi:hypothetical protein